MNITSLIFRRRYPVPVTLDDLYRAIVMADMVGILTPEAQRATTAAMKQVTNAIDEIYAVADGREVRVAVVRENGVEADCPVTAFGWGHDFRALLEVADEQGYWGRPHEVRLDLVKRESDHA